MKQISEDALAGAVSGLASRLLTSPLDVIKIRFQLQCSQYKKYHSITQTVRSIIKEEGVLSLWKGNIPGMHLWVTYSLVQFSTYGVFKSLVSAPTSNMFTGLLNFCAGAGASLVATAVTYPLDIMRTQFAIQGKERIHLSMWAYCLNTFQSRGVKGFYAGMSAAMLSVAPYMGLNFVFYEFSHLQLGTLHQRLTEHPSRSSSSLSSLFAGTISFASGAFAGGLSKTLIYPLDTVKKRLQAEVLQNTLYDRHSLDYGHDKGRINTNTSKYINFRHCIKKIFREEGIRGFYKGYLPTLLKSVFSTSIAFGAFELTKKSLSTFSQEQ